MLIYVYGDWKTQHTNMRAPINSDLYDYRCGKDDGCATHG